MAITLTLTETLPRSVGTELFGRDIGPARMRHRTALAVARLWAWLGALPDRPDAAVSNDLPPEFSHFPPF